MMIGIPVIQNIELRCLTISDISQQREISINKIVNDIVENFDQHGLGILYVNSINGNYKVFDGRHRLVALWKMFKDSNPCKLVKCYVYSNLTTEEENHLYSMINNVRKHYKSELSVARLKAGHQELISLSLKVDTFGFKLSTTHNSSRNTIPCVDYILELSKKLDQDNFMLMLKLLKDTFNGEAFSLKRNMLKLVSIFVVKHNGEIDAKRFIKAFSKKKYNDLIVGTNDKNYINMVDIYNYKQRNDKKLKYR